MTNEIEFQQHSRFDRRDVFGKSTVMIKCPYCGTVTKAFIWSLNGSGKRCDGCDAVHMGFGITRRKKRWEQK